MSETSSVSPQLCIDTFQQICTLTTDESEYPNASSVDKNVVIYEGNRLGSLFDSGVALANSRLRSEFTKCLSTGPGVFIIRSSFSDPSIVTRSTEILKQIVRQEKAAGNTPADHFGNNERIWNSLQKACLADPLLFTEYYENPFLHLASLAWLGPNYRITAQLNNVKPGGKEQSAHRDYHLGFQSAETIEQFPLHAQVMSQYLTLQGAIAHTDMTVEHGPTLFLPFSHQYELGYMAHEHAEFRNFFSEHRVQLPLSIGDMVFFNPALFHAGGANSTTEDRIANLIQVSSAMGRTMESLDHQAMIQATYPVLLGNKGIATEQKIRNVIATIADGYAFPTNLDSDPPIDGNAPATQRDMLTQSVAEGWSPNQLQTALTENRNRRQA